MTPSMNFRHNPGFQGSPALLSTSGALGVTTGPVMMVYGLDTKKLNCDKLFNLFCLYGNIARIKFLKTKEGAAMIQMGDGSAVERCVQHLNNAPMFDSKNRLQLGFSKQPFLSDVTNPFVLPDGSPSFKDFIRNKYNRFANLAMSLKNRIQSPSRILHFFNTPPSLTEKMLLDLFEEKKIVPPLTIKIFPMKSERSSSGLIEFEDIEGAIEALVVLNHAPIENPNGKFPYTMKLCFSSSRQVNVNGTTRVVQNNGNNNNNNNNNNDNNNGQQST
ncbi:heterogeneous nuclear ribonucleoprotein L, putative [Pediculus humanus corporis]|uniref:Heterogeneous nuclear ribonucleoprotein L, putative n=1 Tax=Pediculus humanus subsp. corporis TaxID=121224 RepID=E0VY40_PEDHC|nr:heterogeneous nuclear ribonucleoprotein L, putative [Pediculus humanus corporis]EEB18296.1 heterogeneous nuclear ribonucleoprotein L, putative [Pediculus humanus corporis]